MWYAFKQSTAPRAKRFGGRNTKEYAKMSIWKKAGIKVQITGRSKIAAAIITGALAVFIAVELAEFFKP